MGVIVGPDLVVEDSEVHAVPLARASQYQSIRGYRAMMQSNPERANALGDLAVKNMYRILMIRGMKGCYVYCVDPTLANRLRARLVKASAACPGREPS